MFHMFLYRQSRLRCIVELLLFSSRSRDHCHAMLLSFYCGLSIRYLFDGVLTYRGDAVMFQW